MKVLDLFSGIGGFSLGLERAGMETVAFCEIEPYCQKVLKKHWPDIPIYDDIRSLNGEQFRGTIDLICGGFPCQPFSSAGKRNGQKDDRHLWPEMRRIISEARPTWVIGENVFNFAFMGLRECISDLEALDYEIQPFVIPACAVGANHIRNRIFFCCNSNSNSKSIGSINEKTPWMRETASDTDGELVRDKCWWRRGQNRESQKVFGNNGAGEWWVTESPLCGANDGVSHRMDRLRALGNAVVPQIPEIIGRAIMEIENATHQPAK